MRNNFIRTRTWPIGTYARSSPYWIQLQHRKARSGRPVNFSYMRAVDVFYSNLRVSLRGDDCEEAAK